MVVIGLTGGIGTGKSEVSKLLQELGAVVIDADRLGHEAYRPHTEAWQEVVAAFGSDILQPNGDIDRKKLGQIVFNDAAALAKLNAIMHPKIARMARERIQQLQTQGIHTIVLEAAVLIEAGWTSLVDEVWVTWVPVETAIRRVQARNHLPEDAVRARINSQMPFEERSKHARVVIDNSGDLEQLRRQVHEVWNSRIRQRVKSNATS